PAGAEADGEGGESCPPPREVGPLRGEMRAAGSIGGVALGARPRARRLARARHALHYGLAAGVLRTGVGISRLRARSRCTPELAGGEQLERARQAVVVGVALGLDDVSVDDD